MKKLFVLIALCSMFPACAQDVKSVSKPTVVPAKAPVVKSVVVAKPKPGFHFSNPFKKKAVVAKPVVPAVKK